MKVNASNATYQSTVGDVPVGTVVVLASGSGTGDICIVAFEEAQERCLVVNLATGDINEMPLDTRCTAYPSATMRLTGWLP